MTENIWLCLIVFGTVTIWYILAYFFRIPIEVKHGDTEVKITPRQGSKIPTVGFTKKGMFLLFLFGYLTVAFSSFFLYGKICSQKEEFQFKGKIVSGSEGETPVQGAIIYVKNDPGDTVSDTDGNFSLNVKSSSNKWKKLCPTCGGCNNSDSLIVSYNGNVKSFPFARPFANSQGDLIQTYNLSN